MWRRRIYINSFQGLIHVCTVNDQRESFNNRTYSTFFISNFCFGIVGVSQLLYEHYGGNFSCFLHILTKTVLKNLLQAFPFLHEKDRNFFFFTHSLTCPACSGWFGCLTSGAFRTPCCVVTLSSSTVPPELSAADVYAAIVSVHCCLQPFHGEAMDLIVSGLR